MPSFARILMGALLVAAAGTAHAQPADRYADRYAEDRQAEDRYADEVYANDRYGDWRSGADAEAEADAAAAATEQPTPAVDPFATPETLPAKLAARPIADEPEGAPNFDRPTLVGKPRRLPFRFEPAPAGRQAAKVVQASATEPVVEEAAAPQEISAPRDPRPLSREVSQPKSAERAERSSLPSASTLLGSVAIVAGLFLIVAWLARRAMPRQPPLLPREALEVLGRQRFGGKQEMQLLRVGNKLVLVHVVPGHAEALTEITDPDEIERLTTLCYQSQTRTGSRSFHQTLSQYTSQPAATRHSLNEPVDKLDLSMFDGLGLGNSRKG